MEQEIIGLFTSMDLQNASWIGCEHICKGMYMIGACGIMENPLWGSLCFGECLASNNLISDFQSVVKTKCEKRYMVIYNNYPQKWPIFHKKHFFLSNICVIRKKIVPSRQILTFESKKYMQKLTFKSK